MNPLVLVDFSNYCYACWYPAVSANKADPKYDIHRVFETNLMGKIGTLQRVLDELGHIDSEILFVEDRRSARKYELWPQYKGKRKAMEYDPRPEAKEYLKTQGYAAFCHSPDNEADDAIASLVAEQGPSRDIIICSSDKDLWQLVRDNVSVWQLTKDKFVTKEMILEEFEVSQPQQIPIVKALWGDSGDNVPNCMPRMKKHLLEGVEDSADIDSFFAGWSNFGPPKNEKAAEALKKGEAQARLNWKLVKLDPTCQIVRE